MYQVYGIKNCDTVKKALSWLDKNNIEYEFIDFKKSIPEKELLASWKKTLGDFPVNQKGRTYKQHQDVFENASESQKYKLMQDYTSLIKRPVVCRKGKLLLIGFEAESYAKTLL